MWPSSSGIWSAARASTPVASPTRHWSPALTPPTWHGGSPRDEDVSADAQTKQILGAAILGVGGDEAIHGILDMMNARADIDTLQWAVPIHPTVPELIPTLVGELKTFV